MYDILLLVDSMEAIKDLPDRDAGALIKALIKHTDGEDPEKLPSMAKALYPLIRGQVERMADIRDKRAEAGRRGGKANAKQNGSKTEANAKQNGSPVPVPVPLERDTERNRVQRSKKVQNAFGFSTERPDVNYDEIIAQRMREEREAAE
jgi:hypothetical protein